MTTYTAFDDEFEEHAPQLGLSLEGAFQWVMGSCGYDYRFERRGDGYVLSVWDLDYPNAELMEETSTLADNADAMRELMLRSVDGRFQAKMALPDDEFRARLREARACMDIEPDSRA